MQKSLRTLPVVAALAVFAFGAMSASPATAGLHYQAVSSGEAGGRSQQTKVEGWVSGDKARVEFKQSDNPAPMAPMAPMAPITKAGNYIITKDGGKTLYLVNVEDKTYAQWDLNAMLGMVGGVMNGMGPMLKFEFSDPKVEKLGEEDGGTVVGYPTRHYKYRTSYSMKMKVFGMASNADTVTEQEVWATTKLVDGGLKVWLRSDPPRTGNEAFDKLIAAEAEKSKTTGFPLKTVSTTTSTRKGKASVSKHSMEVTLIENKAVPDSSFEIPVGYKEAKMLEDKGESPHER